MSNVPLAVWWVVRDPHDVRARTQAFAAVWKSRPTARDVQAAEAFVADLLQEEGVVKAGLEALPPGMSLAALRRRVRGGVL